MRESCFELSSADQSEALEVDAGRSGRPAHLLEKDIWVVWALAAIYNSPLGDTLSVGAVKAQAHDTKTGKKVDIVIPNPDAPTGSSSVTHSDRHVYPNSSAAKAAARAKLAGMNRQTASRQLELRGRADLAAEKSVELQGFKQEVDGTYLIESVTQQLAGQKLEHVGGSHRRQFRQSQSWTHQAPSTQNDRGHPQRPVTR